MLLAVAWLYALGGSLEFIEGGALNGADSRSRGVLTVIFVMLITGLGVKAALVPLHGWLPLAMVAPAPVSALLHAVAVVKAGAFGMVRVVYDVFGIELSAELGLTGPLVVLASVTIVYGSLRALAQDELKRRLAFSTVSQVSYIALGIALGSPLATIGGIVHLVHQGLMKITLFFCAGNLAETLGVHHVSDMRGVARRMPWTMAAFTLGALGMIGVPPLAGFISKWYLGIGAIEAEQPMVSVVVGMYALHHGLAKGALFLGVGVAAARIDTAWQRGLVGGGLLLPALALAGAPYTSGAAAKASLKAVTAMAPSAWLELLATLLPLSAVGTTLLLGRFVIVVWPRPTSHSSRLTPGLWVPWALLLLGTSVSVFAWPWQGDLTPLIDAFSSKLVWKAFWPVGIGALVVLGVWGWSRWIGWRSDWHIPAGDILVPFDSLIEVMRRNGGVAIGKSLTKGVDQVTSKWAAVTTLKPWRTMLSRSEQRLANWSVAGMLFLFLAAALLACLITLST